MKTPDFEAQFEKAWMGGKTQRVEYSGKLLVPGEDAAIVMTSDASHAFLDNAPAPAEHAFSRLVARYEKGLRLATAHEFGRNTREISLLGRWHENGPDRMDYEPYITRKIGQDGAVRKHKYDYDIFPFDGLGSGEGSFMAMNRGTDPSFARHALASFSDRLTNRGGLSERIAVSLGLPMGVVWYPPKRAKFPILVTEWTHKGDQPALPSDARQFA